MRCLLAVAGFSSLLAAGYLVVAASQSPPTPAARPEPALALSPAEHDFGEVDAPGHLTARFEVANTYGQSAEVVQVIKGCACAEADVEPRSIPAGGTAALRVVWRMAGKRGRATEAVVLVCRVGERTEHLRARVLARVVSPVEPDRETIVLDPRARRSERVVFRARDGRPFRLTGAGANHPSLTATIGPDGRSLAVAFDPAERNWDSGLLQVSVTTDVPDAPHLVLPVSVTNGTGDPAPPP